tara:strand:- start:1634 stop:2452 length:819 start_codon:yes stop_codon:yes gene_type:complete
MVDQSITVKKNIYIDCGDAPLNNYHLKPGKKKYTWLGNEIPGTGCINYGCCYDVAQTAQVTLSSVNETILTKSTEMWNTMSAELDSRVQMTIDSGGPGSSTYQESKNSAKNFVIEKIEKEFENLVNTNYEGSQDIHIKVEGPLVCVNECDEPPSAGLINQSINVDIATKNIVSQFISSVSKNYMDLSLESDVSVTNLDMPKLYMFCSLTVSFWMFIYILGCILSCIPAQLKPMCKLSPHIGGIIFTFIIIWIWKIISCIFIRSGSKIGCLFR